MWCIKQHKPGVRGAADLQELRREGGVIINSGNFAAPEGLSTGRMQSFDLSPCFSAGRL